ncbi:MAG TPA: pilus assembly protein TadG-related protein [Terriglobales bacterium]|nr:pilus assembly protein TadG-related protein [Terriglobales bacterium]
MGYEKIRPGRERGQAAVFLVLALGLFLIGGVGFIVDGANLWFHHQSAQTAADAACTAGAMDLLSQVAGVTPPTTPWIPTSDDGSLFHCSGTTGGSTSNSSFPPCAYANLNGYSGSASQDVLVSFPVLSVVTACPTAPPFSQTACAADDLAATPYMQVEVHDSVPTTFMRLVGAAASSTVPARSRCGLSNVLSPVPILVLNPNDASPSAVNTFATDTGFSLKVLNGPQKSIQINSVSSVPDLDSGTIDLSEANNGKGGDFAVAARDAQPTGRGSPTIDYGTSGKWVTAAGVVSDPFATIDSPASASLSDCTGSPSPCVVYGSKGDSNCPDAVDGCDIYSPGRYPTGITVQNGAFANETGLAVFLPGIYYLGGNLSAGTNSCLRSGITEGDGNGGTMFYFSGSATLSVVSTSGALKLPTSGSNPGSNFDCASTNPSWAVSVSSAATCPGGSLGLGAVGVTELTGNVLLAPCAGTYGDPQGAGIARGMLFFQDREAVSAAPVWNSAGSFALVGNLYFHDCQSSTSTGTGANCISSAFTDTLTLGSGANAYIVGDIVADQLSLLANSNITVSLSPNPQYYVLKASLLQ